MSYRKFKKLLKKVLLQLDKRCYPFYGVIGWEGGKYEIHLEVAGPVKLLNMIFTNLLDSSEPRSTFPLAVCETKKPRFKKEWDIYFSKLWVYISKHSTPAKMPHPIFFTNIKGAKQ